MQLFKFVDLFGIAGFLFLLIDAIWDLRAGKQNWRVYARMMIAVVGLIVDVFVALFY